MALYAGYVYGSTRGRPLSTGVVQVMPVDLFKEWADYEVRNEAARRVYDMEQSGDVAAMRREDARLRDNARHRTRRMLRREGVR